MYATQVLVSSILSLTSGTQDCQQYSMVYHDLLQLCKLDLPCYAHSEGHKHATDIKLDLTQCRASGQDTVVQGIIKLNLGKIQYLWLIIL